MDLLAKEMSSFTPIGNSIILVVSILVVMYFLNILDILFYNITKLIVHNKKLQSLK